MSANVTRKCDVLVVGAGPAGAAFASLFKAIDRDREVVVVDHRETTRRFYGQNIGADGIDDMTSVLRENLRDDNKMDHEKINNYIKFLNGWKNTVQVTKDIEDGLAFHANAFGVTMDRSDFYGKTKETPEPAITVESLDKLFDPNSVGLTEAQKRLHPLFQSAKLIVDATGAHSPFRTKFVKGGDQEGKVDVVNLQHFIEIKCQTPRDTEKRNVKMSFKESTCSGAVFETMKNEGDKPLKPLTAHFYVGKKTAAAFAEATDRKPWNFTTLQEKAINNGIVENMTLKIAHYLKGLLDRGGACIDEVDGKYCIDAKIKPVPITMYRSAQAVTVHEGTVIAELGDAWSGAVFARGATKACREAARLAVFAKEFFKSRVPVTKEIPEPFVKYEKAVIEIFNQEKPRAKRKASGIKVGLSFLRIVVKPIRWLISPLKPLYTWIKSLFFGKEMTIGEMMNLMNERLTAYTASIQPPKGNE